MTTWYAQDGAGNMSTRNWNDAAGGGGSALVWNNQATGDTFDANGQTGIAIDVDPKGTGGATSVNLVNTSAAGAFTYATAANITITANITAGAVVCLAITGNSGGGTIIGNITGGSAGAAHGVNDGHAVVTITVTGNLIAGSSTSTSAYVFSGSSGSIVINGNVTGGAIAGSAVGLTTSAAGTATVNGDVTGGSGLGSAYGVTASGAGAVTITGNLINSAICVAANGRIVWAPSNAQKYIKFDGGGTVVYASKPPSGASILSSASYVDSATGTYTAGTASSGGSHGF